MKHRELRYDIDYLTADGTKRGREPCTVTVHTDGQRTIRARSEIFDTEIVRDVTYTVGPDFRPVDCFIRVRQWDQVIGSTWFRFDGAMAECEGFTANEGRISQRVDFDKPPSCSLPMPSPPTSGIAPTSRKTLLSAASSSNRSQAVRRSPMARRGRCWACGR